LKRLLLVEDDHAIRWSLKRALSTFFEITETDSALEALRFINEGAEFDAIVTDVSLIEGGNPSGLVVASQARKELPRAAIVVMSGQILSEMAETMLRDIAAAFLPKPFYVEELLAVLNESLLAAQGIR